MDDRVPQTADTQLTSEMWVAKGARSSHRQTAEPLGDGYAGFRSTLMTRGGRLPRSATALRKKRLADAESRRAVSRKSMVCPVESTARYRYQS